MTALGPWKLMPGQRPALLAALATLLILAQGLCPAYAAPLGAGQPLPSFELQRPAEVRQIETLGLPPGTGNFRAEQVQRPWLFIQIFNMYCTICQREAAQVNQLYELIQKSSFKDKLAFFAIGAGNSWFEVKVFKKKFSVPFAMLPDKKYEIHKLLGEPRTPYFLLVKRNEDGSLNIVQAHAGPLGDPQTFFQSLHKNMQAR